MRRVVLSAYTRHRCADRLAARERAERYRAQIAASAIVRPCAHPRRRPGGTWVEGHPHGSAARYTLDHCRCSPCRSASADYARRRKAQLATGRWNGLVDADPVRRHVLALRAAGLSTAQLVEEAGVSRSCLDDILPGRAGRAPARRILHSSARAVLAIPVDHRAIMLRTDPRSAVPAVGTQRRLQALVALGWSMAQLAARVGVEANSLRRLINTNPKVLATTARTVATLYQEMWNARPAPVTRPQHVAVTKTVNLAARRGWVIPAMWDDDVIDDPAGRPAAPHARVPLPYSRGLAPEDWLREQRHERAKADEQERQAAKRRERVA
jgi:lambda repressor-like predicted transcriptional regulator